MLRPYNFYGKDTDIGSAINVDDHGECPGYIGTVCEGEWHFWYYEGVERDCHICRKKENLVKSGGSYVWTEH